MCAAPGALRGWGSSPSQSRACSPADHTQCASAISQGLQAECVSVTNVSTVSSYSAFRMLCSVSCRSLADMRSAASMCDLHGQYRTLTTVRPDTGAGDMTSRGYHLKLPETIGRCTHPPRAPVHPELGAPPFCLCWGVHCTCTAQVPTVSKHVTPCQAPRVSACRQPLRKLLCLP